jgi:two-component system chemotaxis response regulator CheB
MPDIIAIGTSMGGLEALQALFARLQSDLPASIFVVKHVAPYAPSMLAPLLDRVGPLTAVTATDGEPIVRGRIYVAPPDLHMIVSPGVVRLSRGPHENHTRPAIDPLFRSVGVAYGPRAVGVVLTGLLNDGASGLRAIKRCGGVTIVQDPHEAAYPDMPRAALNATEVDYRVPVGEMAALLDRLARGPAGKPVSVPADLQAEVRIAEGVPPEEAMDYASGPAAGFSCPECGGSLFELETEGVNRYRCRVGHGYTAEALLTSQDGGVDDALWAAVRTMQERVQLLSRLAEDSEERGARRSAEMYRERAAESGGHAETIRRMLVAKSSREATVPAD